MAIRKIDFMEGEFYHIYNRGNSKQAIFKDKEDYNRFVELLYISNCPENFNLFDLKRNSNFNVFTIERKSNLVAIGAYCLMPNHFHLLLTPTTEDGVSKFMQKLATAYSMYFNRKYKRTGGLFEGKFKAEHASNDNYLKYLFSYIHLNPIKLIDKNWKEGGLKDKKQAINFLNTYDFSSYANYMDPQKPTAIILNIKAFPQYFTNQKAFKSEIFDWINFGDNLR